MPAENTIPEHLSVRATTLEEAWSRFDPQEPLPNGSPFYVPRPDDPLGRLKRGLTLIRPGGAPKYFFAGHRGCGKSTELNRLVADPDILARYWPVKFSVREECDFNDLSHIEVLLTIGAQIYHQYTSAGGRMKKDLLDELERWKNTTVTNLKEKGAVFETGAGFDIGQFLLAAVLKTKTEHITRRIVREEIGRDLSRLIGIINLMSAEVLAQSKRTALVVVEDMDKPSLQVAKKVFEESLANLTQPICAIVYTVPVAIYFDPAYTQIRECSHFLPNVKLHDKGRPEPLLSDGLEIMRRMALARLDEALIHPDALTEAVRLSGDVFREMSHLMQQGIDNALARGNRQVQLEDVNRAAAQIRTAFRRQLSDDDYRLLLEVQATNEMRHPEKLSGLLHLLAALEYNGEEGWCDVHPVLASLLAEIKNKL